MTTDSHSPVTLLLEAARRGEQAAKEELLQTLYRKLRQIADAEIASGPASHTLQATALVNEAYVRLLGKERPEWANRRHFFFAAARAMRDVLVEDARRKSALRRGAGWQRVDLEHVELAIDASPEIVLALDEALSKLEAKNERHAELVRLRFFTGLSEEQTAKALGVSLRTVSRDWQYLRAWLYAELEGWEAS